MSLSLRVLVNDDSPADSALIVRELGVELSDSEFVLSSDRESFARRLEEGRWDVIVSDFSLPAFNAFDALEMTRAVDPDVPFIVVSGTIGEERAAELIRSGVTDYLMKDHLDRIASMVVRAVREARERTALEDAERQLIEAANEWRDTVDAIPDGILMLRPDGRVRRSNRAANDLPGVEVGALIGMSWSEVLKAMCPDSCVLPSAPEIAGRFQFEWGPCGPNELWYLVSYDPIHGDAHNEVGFVMVFLDITARKLADEAQAALMERLKRTIEGSVAIAIRMVESRDPYTAGHQENVARLASAIAVEMGRSDIDMNAVRMAGELHDIGKVAVPAEILMRPGELDATEWAIIRRHPSVAEQILHDADFGGPVVETVLQHHERIDGSGYPAGLGEDEIRIEAKILAVADVAEAMMAHRPYRAALPADVAVAELKGGRGVRYDTEAVDACLAVLERDPRIIGRSRL